MEISKVVLSYENLEEIFWNVIKIPDRDLAGNLGTETINQIEKKFNRVKSCQKGIEKNEQ